MTKATKKEHFDYIVSLPKMDILNLENTRNLEVVVSTSDRGAVSHALARKTHEKLHRELKSNAIRHAMNQLDVYYGGAENYAFEVQSEFSENGIEMTKFNPRYRDVQEAFLAEEISKKRDDKNMLKSLRLAKSYLDFYYSHRY